VSQAERFVIVGASMAGGAAATTLRGEGFEGRIVLIGDEPHAPYERPPLSKDYLRGETPLDHFTLHPDDWYGENDVDLRLGARAEAVDPAARQVRLAGGELVGYDRLLVATGARNRVLDVPGADLDGVLQLRTLEDADRIRAAAKAGGKAVIVGAGFIGMEVAASLRAMGVEVDVIEFFDAPMVRALGPEMGRVVEGIHRDHGVRFWFGEAVERLEGDGRVERVVTGPRSGVDADFVVAGVGVQPNVEIVAGTDVEVDNGILVDAFCRTNVPEVFAAGDVANHEHPVFERRLRVEHFDNAQRMGTAAAKNMAGGEVVFDDPHWFWSDQYDHTIDYAGFATEWDDVVIRGSVQERAFVAFYVKDGRVLAAFGVDKGRDVRRAKDLIKLRRPVDSEKLRDPDVDLKKLAAELSAAGG
jgi:3-phenylpropionate/trans-cinnamate dioxygenase ferredoxin reductase component